jgi:hypothetical protein
MQSPLIPDINHPKWIMANKILETIDSPRARKIAHKLKVYDVSYFLVFMKILVLSNLFERDASNAVEHNKNLRETIYMTTQKLNKLEMENQSLYTLLERLRGHGLEVEGELGVELAKHKPGDNVIIKTKFNFRPLLTDIIIET